MGGPRGIVTADFPRFMALMLELLVALGPAQFEAMFVSSAHTEADLAATLAAVEESFAG